METVSNQSEVSSQPVSVSTSPELNTQPNQKDVNSEVKGMLAEARNTRDMLVGFRSAVESGNYNGNKMFDLAKGLAFIEAILKQNNAHIHNLQERLEAK